jgi:hypothetical protein
MDNMNYRDHYGGLVRESTEYHSQRYREEDQYSVAVSANGQSMRSRVNDTKVNLVGESLPNYARIDHFANEHFDQQQHYSADKSQKSYMEPIKP